MKVRERASARNLFRAGARLHLRAGTSACGRARAPHRWSGPGSCCRLPGAAERRESATAGGTETGPFRPAGPKPGLFARFADARGGAGARRGRRRETARFRGSIFGRAASSLTTFDQFDRFERRHLDGRRRCAQLEQIPLFLRHLFFSNFAIFFFPTFSPLFSDSFPSPTLSPLRGSTCRSRLLLGHPLASKVDHLRLLIRPIHVPLPPPPPRTTGTPVGLQNLTARRPPKSDRSSASKSDRSRLPIRPIRTHAARAQWRFSPRRAHVHAFLAPQRASTSRPGARTNSSAPPRARNAHAFPTPTRARISHPGTRICISHTDTRIRISHPGTRIYSARARAAHR